MYLANKQQAFRCYKIIKDKGKGCPLRLRDGLINIRKAKAFCFLKIPVHGIRGGIRVRINAHGAFQYGELCESKVVGMR